MSFSKKIGLSFKWSVIASLVTFLFSFVQNIVVAWFLQPSELGIMASLLILINLAMPFIESGFSASIIHSKKINAIQIETLFWINIIAGFLFFIFLNTIAIIPTRIEIVNEVSPYIFLISLNFLIFPICLTSNALLEKKLRINIISKIRIFSNSLSFAATVAMAYLGYGVLALLYGYLILQFTSSCLTFWAGKNHLKINFAFDIKKTSFFIQYGVTNTVNGFINLLASNLDKIFIFLLLGTHELGYYTLIWSIIMAPLFKINPIFMRLLFPIFSEFNDQPKLLDKYFSSSLFAIIILILPSYAFASLFAEDLILMIYGTKWVQASGAFALLCWVGIYKCLSNPAGVLLLALGKINQLFKWHLLNFFLHGVVLFVALKLNASLKSVALGHILICFIMGPLLILLINKNISLNLKLIAKNTMTIISIVLPILLIIYILYMILGSSKESLIACIVLYILTCLLVVHRAKKNQIYSFLNLFGLWAV